MIRDKKANVRRDTLEAPDVNPHANGPDKKHDAFHTRPVNRVRIAGDQRVDQQRLPDEQDVQRQEDANEKSPEHRQAKLSRITRRWSSGTWNRPHRQRMGIVLVSPRSIPSRMWRGFSPACEISMTS